MITLGKESVLQTWASWHADQDINRQQAEKLAADALATRKRLAGECLALHLGRSPAAAETNKLNERREPGSPVVFVCYGDTAIAVRTDPVSHVKDCRYYLTWHWKALNTERN